MKLLRAEIERPMFDNLNLRGMFLAIAAVPVYFLVAITLWAAVLLGEPFLAAAAALGAIATVVLAHHLGGRLTARVEALAGAVEELVSDQLPAIVKQGGHGSPSDHAELTADDDESDDGAGQLTTDVNGAEPGDTLSTVWRSIASIGPRTSALLHDQEVVTQRQLSDLVKNLTRRNQSLLDRQIEHIDWLEDTEQVPERLEQLFKLDHLATRLRRSSETVLVLVGGESTRARGAPAPIATILRVAMGETEAYTKIKLRTIEEVLIAGGPAFDLAHLVAELLENATQFSPPETPVELQAVHLDDGTYRITVVDRGVGMDDSQLVVANASVSNPPDLNLSIGRSIGLIVIGRLARRLQATVEISPTPGSGVTATVVVPSSIVVSTEAPKATATPISSDAVADLQGGRVDGQRPQTVGGSPRPIVEVPTAEGAGPDVVDRIAQAGLPTEAEPNGGPAQEAEADDGEEPTAKASGASAPDRPRVTEDSSNALSKLLGLTDELSDLEQSNDWTAPDVDQGGSKPLKSRANDTPPRQLAGPTDESSKGGEKAGSSKEPESDKPTAPLRRRSQARKRHARGRSKLARTLEEAVPTGAVFDTGIKNLLAYDSEPELADEPAAATDTEAEPSATDTVSTPEPVEAETDAEDENGDESWTPPTVSTGVTEVLSRRQKGASSAPAPPPPLARASTRKPDEIRSMITRYRDGLKGSPPTKPEEHAVPAPGPAPDPVIENGKEDE